MLTLAQTTNRTHHTKWEKNHTNNNLIVTIGMRKGKFDDEQNRFNIIISLLYLYQQQKIAYNN